MSHWLSTLITFRSWGVPEIRPTVKVAAFPKASRDIEMRMQGAPAGTAKLFLTIAVLKRIANSAYKKLMPVVNELDAIVAELKLVKKHPARFHVGSFYLTKRPQRPVQSVSEDLLQVAAAVVHGAFPNSTLAKSPVFPGPDETEGMYERINLQKARRAMMTAEMTEDQIQALGFVRSEEASEAFVKTVVELDPAIEAAEPAGGIERPSGDKLDLSKKLVEDLGIPEEIEAELVE
jgi:hypothetical protein